MLNIDNIPSNLDVGSKADILIQSVRELKQLVQDMDKDLDSKAEFDGEMVQDLSKLEKRIKALENKPESNKLSDFLKRYGL